MALSTFTPWFASTSTNFIFAAALTGCASVGAHERGLLARPEMDPGSEALEESFHAHVEAAREGAAGGHGVVGGGCGCG